MSGLEYESVAVGSFFPKSESLKFYRLLSFDLETCVFGVYIGRRSTEAIWPDQETNLYLFKMS